MKAPSPPTRRRTPGNSPNSSGSFMFPRSSSPVYEVSNEFKRKVEKARRARLYLLQQTGPNSFLIGGDSPDHKFRVMIGPQVQQLTLVAWKLTCPLYSAVFLRREGRLVNNNNNKTKSNKAGQLPSLIN